jgi:hypothetical protein
VWRINFDPGILCHRLIDDANGFVGGTIVDDEDFQIGAPLSKDTIETLAEVIFGIVDGDADGDTHKCGAAFWLSFTIAFFLVSYHNTRAPSVR